MAILFLVIGAIGAFFVLAALLGWHPVEDWRERAWREASSWLNGIGIANVTAALGLWNQMPLAVQRAVPASWLLYIGLALWVLAWLAKYTAQPKAAAKIAAKKGVIGG